MKTMKKLMTLVLSIAMVLALGVTAFAEETGSASTYKITAPATNHQYEIYQIFTGDLSENGVLSNVKWGINGIGKIGDLVDEATIKSLTEVNSKSDKEKLEVIEQYAELSKPVATIKNGETYTAVAGYYLIKDKDGTVSGTDAYTTYIVQVVDNVTIKSKSDVPSFEKKVKDTNDTTGDTSGWQDSADYDIGDEVPFQLKGTVASNYEDYKSYYFAFHDVEERGLNFKSSSVKVYVNSKEITKGYEVKTKGLTDDCSFEVVFNDLKKLKEIAGVEVGAGSVITVEYTSTLNDDAVIGNTGNVNKAKLEFSNNPNQTQGGTPETGETPWDNVIVFTYKVVVNKYANSVADTNKLTGAEFTLSKKFSDGSTKDITVVKSDNGTSFTFSGLDDGDYILTETKTPAGYNTIKPITFRVTAEHKVEWTLGDTDGNRRTDVLTSLSGAKVSGEIQFTAAKEEGQLAADVINKSGSTLPSTGGMGTTIFYVVGTILVLAAVVLLITKKRMHADK